MKKTIVSLQKALTYRQPELGEVVKRLLAPLGGIEFFVKPGHKVLLKPNMLTCKGPEKAATTHPALVEEVARICVAAGAEVIIGDSPPAIFGRTEAFWETTGLAKAAHNSGARLLSFETDAKAPITFFSNGKSLSTPIVKTYFMADVVINLPKMKTHNLTRITGAIKNLFGLIPGFTKAGWHKAFPRPVEFSNFIADFSHQLPCALTIMDAIDAMDGQGPAGGRVVNAGVLLASVSPVAIDMAFCELVGLNHHEIPILQHCHELNWGPREVDEIDFAGATPDQLFIKDYQVPSLPPIALIPDFIINSTRKLVWAGPALLPNTCIKCGKCRKICPVNAIDITENGAEFDRKLCISCFCCMEVCPVDAIEMKSSPLLTMGSRLRKVLRELKKRRKK